MKTDVVDLHAFCFNPEDNGGESIILYTEFHFNGDENGVFTTHSLVLNSYANEAKINVGIQITPEQLRKLADELEKTKKEVINRLFKTPFNQV